MASTTQACAAARCAPLAAPRLKGRALAPALTHNSKQASSTTLRFQSQATSIAFKALWRPSKHPILSLDHASFFFLSFKAFSRSDTASHFSTTACASTAAMTKALRPSSKSSLSSVAPGFRASEAEATPRAVSQRTCASALRAWASKLSASLVSTYNASNSATTLGAPLVSSSALIRSISWRCVAASLGMPAAALSPSTTYLPPPISRSFRWMGTEKPFMVARRCFFLL
mmetsp:Transcript_16106/g.45655  ORF Transcript_16106/g.45655 Transcript_16106/m.45655 type:complete len:229 (-) Transcript_16106:953-1639(-)